MYVGLGQLPPPLDACREMHCVDPQCWNRYPTQCNEWLRAQFLLGCLEDNCERPECPKNFPEECERGTVKPISPPREKEGWSGTTVLLITATVLGAGLWLGRKTSHASG